MLSFHTSILNAGKAIANGLVGRVLARPLFLKAKTNFYFTKTSNKQKYKYEGDYWTCSACYITIQQIEKAYGEVENNWLPTHKKYFMLCKVFY